MHFTHSHLTCFYFKVTTKNKKESTGSVLEDSLGDYHFRKKIHGINAKHRFQPLFLVVSFLNIITSVFDAPQLISVLN